MIFLIDFPPNKCESDSVLINETETITYEASQSQIDKIRLRIFFVLDVKWLFSLDAIYQEHEFL